ncbi:MAG: hypothetical protein JWM85_305 [Acidimicrobiaceae bacterium]|nr:hypothetical protein [Acidimicrobiaceae bacterium]
MGGERGSGGAGAGTLLGVSGADGAGAPAEGAGETLALFVGTRAARGVESAVTKESATGATAGVAAGATGPRLTMEATCTLALAGSGGPIPEKDGPS